MTSQGSGAPGIEVGTIDRKIAGKKLSEV